MSINFNPYTPMLLRQSIDPPIGQRGKLYGGWGGTLIERQRLPEDYLYMTDVVLQNIVPGSVVLVTDMSNVEIVRGIAVGTSLTLSAPYFGAPQAIKVKVRKSTTSPFYQSFETQALITPTGASIYINQLSDE